MSLRCIFRVGSVVTTGAVLLLALAPIGMCQTTPVQKEEPVPSETIDEITVYGDKSLQVLRQELYRAEDNAYNVFNLLNSDMEALVVKHPELFRALEEFSHAKRVLESERQRRCEDKILICQR